MRERIWNEAKGDIPQYEIVRKGHDWHEYPDIHDQTSSLGEEAPGKVCLGEAILPD